MPKKIFFAFIILSSFALCAGDKLQPLDVRTGLWETTVTHSMTGMPPIPPEMLAKMTAEQRARMEQAMKARSAGGPTTTTTKSCITKEKLEKQAAFGEDRKECTRTVLTSSSSRIEMKVHCVDKQMTSDGTFKIEALNSESVKGTMHLVESGSGHSMNRDFTIASRYLGPACGDTK